MNSNMLTRSRHVLQITLPDGSTSSIYTTSPRPNIAISKDTSNHPLWGFPSASGASGPVEDEGGRMGRFARRFANKEETSATSSPAEETASASKAEAAKTVKKEATTGKPPAEKDQVKASSEEPASGGFDMFDLSLEGEEVEVTSHKIIEDSGKKGKKGSGKKK
jgi:ribosomal protein L31